MDEKRAIKALRDFLEAMDIDLAAAGMEKTPERVTKLYAKLFSGQGRETEQLWGERFHTASRGLIAIRNIPFYSVCEHHLVPFLGRISIVYRPKDGQAAGFSKFADIVKVYCRRPQLQERLTRDIAAAVHEELPARGVLVVVEARQLCMIMHGDMAQEADTVTAEGLGCLAPGQPEHKEAWLLLQKGDEDGWKR